MIYVASKLEKMRVGACVGVCRYVTEGDTSRHGESVARAMYVYVCFFSHGCEASMRGDKRRSSERKKPGRGRAGAKVRGAFWSNLKQANRANLDKVSIFKKRDVFLEIRTARSIVLG